MELVNKNLIAVYLKLKSILQALFHDIDLENPFYGEKAFIRSVWEGLPDGLANYAVRLLARQ